MQARHVAKRIIHYDKLWFLENRWIFWVFYLLLFRILLRNSAAGIFTVAILTSASTEHGSSRNGKSHYGIKYVFRVQLKWTLRHASDSCLMLDYVRVINFLISSLSFLIFIYNEIVHGVQRNDRKDKLRIS